MPADSSASPSGASPLREVRYSLRAMLAEVELERKGGAFGHEKLRQDDIRKLFRAKTRKSRGRA